jgi:hypothetical protein
MSTNTVKDSSIIQVPDSKYFIEVRVNSGDGLVVLLLKDGSIPKPPFDPVNFFTDQEYNVVSRNYIAIDGEK